MNIKQTFNGNTTFICILIKSHSGRNITDWNFSMVERSRWSVCHKRNLYK